MKMILVNCCAEMNFIQKLGGFLSSAIIDYPLGFLPTREQVAKELVNWQRDRLNSWIAQGCIFILMIPFSIFLNEVFIRDYPEGILGMFLSVVSHSIVIIPTMRGYSSLKVQIQTKIESYDPVAMIEQFILWWRQPTDPTLRNFVLCSVPFVYWGLFNYQEWIGYQIGGFLVYKFLRIIMQTMVLFYSNLIFHSLNNIWQERELNKVVNEFQPDQLATSLPLSDSFVVFNKPEENADTAVSDENEVIHVEDMDDDDDDDEESEPDTSAIPIKELTVQHSHSAPPIVVKPTTIYVKPMDKDKKDQKDLIMFSFNPHVDSLSNSSIKDKVRMFENFQSS